MRKLAREAVIFGLIGFVLYGGFVGSTWLPHWDDAVIAFVRYGAIYGTTIGLTIWIAYRLVRFAIKG